MQISIEKSFVRELIISGRDGESDDNTDRKFDIKFDKKFLENPRRFGILFKLKIHNAAEFDIDLKYECVFETDEDITDEFKKSHFPNVNAPAIGYPFLRSYVSFLLINSGFEPALLPTINFTHFAKETKEEGGNTII